MHVLKLNWNEILNLSADCVGVQAVFQSLLCKYEHFLEVLWSDDRKFS